MSTAPTHQETEGRAASSTVSAGRWRRVRAPLLTIGGLSLTTLALHFRDPHQEGSWGFCPSNLVFGIDCPGCGGLRAVHDLTDADLGAAASSNLLVAVGIPIAIVVLLVWTWRRWRGTARRLSHRTVNRFWGSLGVIALIFMVLRNIPGSWLAA